MIKNKIINDKTMKKFIIGFFAVAMVMTGGNKASAQGKYGPDSANCVTYLSYYHEYFKQKNYDSALPNWRKAYSICAPTANQNMIIDGTVLMRRLITKNAANKEYRQALIDTLLTLHDIRAKYYTKYTVTALNNKGLDIANYFKEDPAKLYEGLNEIIAANNNKTKPSLLMFNLNAAIALYQNGNLDAETVIGTYQRNLAIIKEIQPEKGLDQDAIDKARADMEGLFITSKVASCENLIALFTPRFDADPDNVELATNIVKMMSNTEDCVNNDLFLRATTSMHKNEPSAQSAYFLYRLNAAQDKIAEAEKYLEEAVALSAEADPKVAADYNMQYASFCLKNGHPAKAYAAAQKTIELDREFAGKAYYIMGTVWGSTSCGGDEISRRSPYWVAVDYMQKAREADPSLADDCNRMIAQYRVYFPQTAEAFMYDLTDGQSYTVSCGGMRATTTVRTQK
jgi:tetratricopeptide (TPR) repeat protein